MSRVDFDKALLDPRTVFGQPETVVWDGGLTREQKLEILERWRHDEERLADSEGEGMGGGERSMLGRVARALTLLDTAGEHDDHRHTGTEPKG